MNRMHKKKVITRATQVLKKYSNPYVKKVGTSLKQETKFNNIPNEKWWAHKVKLYHNRASNALKYIINISKKNSSSSEVSEAKSPLKSR